MKHNQDMNEKSLNESIDARLKNADPVAVVTLDDQLVSEATTSKPGKYRNPLANRFFAGFSPARNRFAFVGVAAVAVTLIAAPLVGLGSNNTGALITLAEAGTTKASETSMAVGGPASTDGVGGTNDKMMIFNPFTYEFSAGASLSTATGKGHVYQAQLVSTPEAVLAKIAKALGVQGSVSEAEYSSSEYPMFTVGRQDGTSKSVTIAWNGTGNWWFNNPLAYTQPDCLKFAKAEDGTEFCESFVEQKPTPELLPSNSEALAQALRIFESTGFKTSAENVSITANEWGVYASSSMQVDGQDTSIEWNVSWSAAGEIASVTGHSVRFIDRGEFTTISQKDAVSRVSDWRYSGAIASSLWAKYSPAIDSGAIAYDEQPALGQDAIDPGFIGTPETSAPPKVVQIEIIQAVKAMMAISDSSGGIWIVPGFIMIGDQNWLTPVFSLQEGVVQLPKVETGIETR